MWSDEVVVSFQLCGISGDRACQTQPSPDVTTGTTYCGLPTFSCYPPRQPKSSEPFETRSVVWIESLPVWVWNLWCQLSYGDQNRHRHQSATATVTNRSTIHYIGCILTVEHYRTSNVKVMGHTFAFMHKSWVWFTGDAWGDKMYTLNKMKVALKKCILHSHLSIWQTYVAFKIYILSVHAWLWHCA